MRQVKAELDMIKDIKAGFTPAKKKELEEEAEQEVKDLVDIDQLKEDQKQEIERLNELHKQAKDKKEKEQQEEIDRLTREHKQKVYETKEEAIVRYELEYMDELAVRFKVEMEYNGDISALNEQGAEVVERSNKREKAFEEKERKERKEMEKRRKEDSGLEF